jgi:GTP-binding protein
VSPGSVPIVAIVGRPNVGKSSLFNRLLRRSAALVDDRPGATRDRSYAPLALGEREGILVDTGGLASPGDDPLSGPVGGQALAALAECDLAILVTDALTGPHPDDRDIAKAIRRLSKPWILAANKVDSPEKEPEAMAFAALGADPVAVSAAHGYGVAALKEAILPHLAPARGGGDPEGPPRLAIIGRPNAGKSSLANRLIGSDRLVVDVAPGTTRDPVDVRIEVRGRPYVLVDTAGIRRQGRVSDPLERVSALRALRALGDADIGILMVDATLGLADQDAHIAGHAFEGGRPLITLLNKWDLVRDKAAAKKEFEKARELGMPFLAGSPWFPVSAQEGKGLAPLFPMVDRIMAQYSFKAKTADVNKAIEDAALRHSPPQAGKVRLKFYYATQVSTRPPGFALFANRPNSVHFSYRRFLKNSLKRAFGLDLVPVRLFIRARHEDRHKGGGRRG